MPVSSRPDHSTPQISANGAAAPPLPAEIQTLLDGPLADPQWVTWARTAVPDQLAIALRSARATLKDEPAGCPEWVDASRQVAALEQVMGERAAQAGGAVQGDELVTFDGTPLTDTGNAERFAARFGRDVRYCHPDRRWFYWDGTRWRPDDSGQVLRLSKDAVRGIYAEAAAEPNDQARKAVADHARRSEARSRREAMIALATAEAGIPVTPDELDRDPWLLNVGNGTVDLRTGVLRPHDRADLLTKLADVPYDPEATCPVFGAFLARIFRGHPDLLPWLQRAVGYSLTGNTREQVIFILYGTGMNGKSTLLRLLLDLLGDYGQQTPTETLLVKRHDGIPNDVAALRGARLVAALEADDGRRLSEALVKQLTGQDKVAARFMRAEWFAFTPAFKLWLATNHKPAIRGTDHAIWRRIRLIPFTETIPGAERDPDLLDKLRAELPGILAWAVAGCLRWQREGLGVPEPIRAATDQYRAEQDVLGAWVTDRCVTGDALQATAADLYASYRDWCESGGEHTLSQRKFASVLAERGFTAGRTRSARYWVGIGLVTHREPVTQGDTDFRFATENSFVSGLTENTRHQASLGGDASPALVADGIEEGEIE